MSTTYYSEIMRLTPIRYYPLADAVGSGTARDRSANAQNGTVSGTVTFGQSPLLKASTLTGALFNGTTGSISVPTTGLPTGASAWSMTCWYKFPSLPGAGTYESVLSLGSNVSNAHNIADLFYDAAANQISLGFASGDNMYTGLTLTAGHVYFSAATYNGTTCKLLQYDTVNGVLQSVSLTVTLNLTYGTATIGVDPIPIWFSGVASHVSIHTTALSADQVAWIYHVGVGAGVIADNHRNMGRIR